MSSGRTQKMSAERYGFRSILKRRLRRRIFWNFLPAYVWHMEEPVCEPPAVALYYVSKLAKDHVKVLLSGEGGDEGVCRGIPELSEHAAPGPDSRGGGTVGADGGSGGGAGGADGGGETIGAVRVGAGTPAGFAIFQPDLESDGVLQPPREKVFHAGI